MIAIITTTLYGSGNDLRFNFAKKFVSKAVNANYRTIVVDASPNSEIGKTLASLGAVLYKRQTNTMGGSRREAFAKTTAHYNPDIYVWTEPEKYDIIRLLPKIVKPIETGAADIVIPRRSRKSLATYPDFQIESEKRVNLAFKEASGIDADMAFGPVAFGKKVAHFFSECDPTKYNLPDNYIQHFAPLEAIKNGAALETSIEIDFKYPPEQKAEESTVLLEFMIKKRLWQSQQLIESYFAYSKALKIGIYAK